MSEGRREFCSEGVSRVEDAHGRRVQAAGKAGDEWRLWMGTLRGGGCYYMVLQLPDIFSFNCSPK